MSRKRLLSLVLSALLLAALAGTAFAAGLSPQYVGDGNANGAIYQTYYEVDAQAHIDAKTIKVSGTLYEKGTFGTWQKVSSCSNTSTTTACMAKENYNTKPGKSYRLEYSATFTYSDGRSETITSSTNH